jgi:hypothetical protein
MLKGEREIRIDKVGRQSEFSGQRFADTKASAALGLGHAQKQIPISAPDCQVRGIDYSGVRRSSLHLTRIAGGM